MPTGNAAEHGAGQGLPVSGHHHGSQPQRVSGDSISEREPSGFRGALAHTTADLDLPYGYTLTMWACGHLAIHFHGPPSVLEIFCFVLGGACAFLSLALLALPQLGPVTLVRVRKSTLLNFFALVAGTAGGTATWLSPSPLVGYLLASFTGTLAYVLVLAAIVRLSLSLRTSS